MELFLLCLVASWYLVGYPVTDLVAARNGHESPRRRERSQRLNLAHERAMARERNRTGPTIAEALAGRVANKLSTPTDREPGPAREYLSELWRDSWGAAGERRRTYGQRRADGELLRQRAGRWAGRAAGAAASAAAGGAASAARWGRQEYERRRSTPPPPPPPPASDSGSRTAPPPPAGPPPSGWRARPGPPPPPPPPDDPPTDEFEIPDPPTVPGRAERLDRPGADPAGPHRRPPRGALEAPQPDRPDLTPPTEPSTGEAPLASVTPIREDLTMTAMDTATGETLDPEAARDFTQSIAQVGEDLLAKLETSIATLTERGVSGEPLAKLETIRESAGQIVADAKDAQTYFDGHIGIADTARSDDTVGGGRYLGVGS